MSGFAEPVTGERAKIFVSYRRDDCAGHAGRLYDRLCDRFGANRIFMDVDSIEPGEDFVEVIDKTVGSCNILLAVIGREWLSSSLDGKRRLDDSADFVRLEIATALRREIRVIPVLVQGAAMPEAKDLPDDLKRLARRNALDVDDLHWHAGIERLIGTIEKLVEKGAPAAVPAGPESSPPLVATTDDIQQERRQSATATTSKARKPGILYAVAGVLLAVGIGSAIHFQAGSGTSGPPPPDEAKTGLTENAAARSKGSPLERFASSEDIRRSITIRAARSPNPTDTLPDGRTRHLYSIWIEAPPEAVRRIAKVLYHYDHQAFEKPRTDSSNAADGFRDSYNGIGAVNADMDVIVMLRDGTELPFKFNMYEAVFEDAAR
jgi:hypothetical protein